MAISPVRTSWFRAVVAAAATAVATAAARAANDNWNSIAGGPWSATNNWSAGVPSSADTGVFNLGLVGPYGPLLRPYMVTLPADEAAAGLLDESDQTTIATGDHRLTIGAGGLQTVAYINSSPITLTIDSTGSTVGGVTAAGPWQVSGGSTLALLGGRSNASGSAGATVLNGTFNASATALSLPSLNVTGASYYSGGQGPILGTGYATLTAGAVATVGSVQVGNVAGLPGQLTVSAGATLRGSGPTFYPAVGAAVSIAADGSPTYAVGGTGTLLINGGAVVATTLVDGVGSAGNGNVYLTNGATLTADLTLGFSSGQGAVQAYGPGTAVTANVAVVGYAASGSILLGSGGTFTATRSVALGEAGGYGRLVASDPDTTVAAVGLTVGGGPVGTTISLGFGGLFSLQNGATAAVAADPVAGVGLTLYQPGTLQVASGATLVDAGPFVDAGGLVSLQISAANLTGPLVTLNGPTTLGGTLFVGLPSGFAPTAGQTFDLFAFNGPTTGTFAALSLPSPGPGLRWDSTNLYTNGTLTAVVPEPAVAGTLAAALLAAVSISHSTRPKPRNTVCLGPSRSV